MNPAMSSRTSASVSLKWSGSSERTFSTPTPWPPRTIGATTIERAPTWRHASRSTRESDSVSRQISGMPMRAHSPERLLSMSTREPSAASVMPLTASETITLSSASSTAPPRAFVAAWARSITTPITRSGSKEPAFNRRCVSIRQWSRSTLVSRAMVATLTISAAGPSPLSGIFVRSMRVSRENAAWSLGVVAVCVRGLSVSRNTWQLRPERRVPSMWP